jgi:hypothetical protein
MILRLSSQPDFSHSHIFRKAGQKKAKPNRLYVYGKKLMCAVRCGKTVVDYKLLKN